MSILNSLTIYLLCHNRPEDARKAIRSILAQSDDNFNFIVSDNSSDDRVQQLVSDEFPLTNYIKRTPMLPVLEHFNCCVSEVSSQYFCLFHDDDLMGCDFVFEMKKIINKYKNAIAFGCNSYIEEKDKISDNLFFKSFKAIEKIRSPRTLARYYYARSQSGAAPFPSYIYNKNLIENQKMLVDGGKYADTTWLINLAKKNSIVWLNKNLMTYRLHNANDSNLESRGDRLCVLAYLKKNKSEIGEDTIADYRCSFIYKVAANEYSAIHATRQQFAKRFLKYYQLTRYVRFSTYMAFARRALVKLFG